MSAPFETIGLVVAGGATLISLFTAWRTLRRMAANSVFPPNVGALASQLAEGLAIGEHRAAERVLLVETDDQARTLLRRVLAQAGYEVTDARSGSEASEVLARSERSSPDVVLVDIPRTPTAVDFLAVLERLERPEAVVLLHPPEGVVATRSAPQNPRAQAAASELRARLAFALGKIAAEAKAKGE